jgi:CRISPR-associated protein Cas1
MLPPNGAGAEAEVPDLLPARMLNEFVYCPRLFHLEWVQQEWRDSADTVAGRRDHRRVDTESGDAPDPATLEDDEELTFVARSIRMSAPEEGLIAVIDLLEGRDGTVVPVDYKHGRPPENGPSTLWEPDRVQLLAQSLILRENGYRCDEVEAYYVPQRRRIRLPIEEADLFEVRMLVQSARAAAAATQCPPPLIDSPKCPRCSLVGICLPDEWNHLAGRADPVPIDVRRLYPARDDATPVYVQTQGSRVGKSGEQLEIQERDAGKRRVRLLDVSQLALFGNVTVTSAALASLFERGIPVCHFSSGGWFRGISHGLGPRNSAVKLEQFRAAENGARSLELARGFIERKILNARTLLRRNSRDDVTGSLNDLKRSAETAGRATSAEQLLGIEGQAARTYFSVFATMLTPSDGQGADFDFVGRNRRPPRDAVNALLSFAYSMLARDWTITCISVGLDPYLGFLHRPRFGRPALALDLMEEFRPLVAESAVLQVINNGEIRRTHLVRRAGAVSLTPAGRKQFLLAYERRMNHLVRHPLFGYRVSYRRLLEVQARLLTRHLTGELPTFTGFRTR